MMSKTLLTGIASVFVAAACSAPADSESPGELGESGDGNSNTSSANGSDDSGGMAIVSEDDQQVFLSDEDDSADSSSSDMTGRASGPVDTGSGVNTGCGSNLVGLIRDFHDTHPDMEVCAPEKNSGKKCLHETGIVEPTLGDDDKPVYAGDPENGTLSTTGKAAFDQWYRDHEEANTTVEFVLNFTQTENNGVTTFVFDSDDPPPDSPEGFFPGPNNYPPGGFFPIDDLDQDGFKMQSLLHPDHRYEWYPHNYHFTFEFVTEFVYNGGEVFTFTGDDDVFVFINRQLVVDLGGIHSKLEGKVDLDAEAERIGLEMGETYPLHFFFAERHETESNFRIETSLIFTECGTLPRAK